MSIAKLSKLRDNMSNKILSAAKQKGLTAKSDIIDIGGELYFVGTANTQNIRAQNATKGIRSYDTFKTIYGESSVDLCKKYLFIGHPDKIVTRRNSEKKRLIAILNKGLDFFNELIQEYDKNIDSISKRHPYGHTIPAEKVYNEIKKLILYMRSAKKGTDDVLNNNDKQKILVYIAWFLLHRDETDQYEFTDEFDKVVDSINKIRIEQIEEGIRAVQSPKTYAKLFTPFDHMGPTTTYNEAVSAAQTQKGGKHMHDIDELLRLLYLRTHIDRDINLNKEDEEKCMYMDESFKQNMIPIFDYFSDTDPLFAQMEQIVSGTSLQILKELQTILAVCNSGKHFYKITNVSPSVISFLEDLIEQIDHSNKPDKSLQKQCHIFIQNDVFIYYGDMHRLKNIKTVTPIDYDDIELDGSIPKRKSHKRKSQSYSYKSTGYISHHELAMSILALSKYLMTN